MKTEYLLYRYIVLTVKGMKNSESYKNQVYKEFFDCKNGAWKERLNLFCVNLRNPDIL